MVSTSRARFLLALVVPMIVAAAPVPPAAIAAYIHEGRFEPGDYQWLRGEFDGANSAEVAAYRTVVDWRQRCRSGDMEEARAELAALGISAGESLDTIPYRTLMCDQVATLPEPLNLHDWAGFVHDVSVVRPIVAGFLTAVSMGEKTAVSDDPDLRDALNARATAEQTLRAGLMWATAASAPGSATAGLTLQQRGILASEIAIAIAARDHANTLWLKEIVASKGWPRRTQVGEKAAQMAWLLAQHADADPAFQIRALRLIEPLAQVGEANPQNFARLYDRVMLKLTGKQRYATQLTCENGELVPRPLDDASLVDAKRREVGMDTLADYKARSVREDGPC